MADADASIAGAPFGAGYSNGGIVYSSYQRTADSPAADDTSGDNGLSMLETDKSRASAEHPVSYIHFVTFLGLRGIETLSKDDIDIESTQASHGLSMQVLRGRVKRGKHCGKVVAVKQARRSLERNSSGRGHSHAERTPRAWILDLYFEMQIMTHRSLCNHPNIVRLLGIAFDSEPEIEGSRWPFSPSLVVEPAECDLAEFFRRRPSHHPLSLQDTFLLIGDVADGLSVLHAHRGMEYDTSSLGLLN